jgi:nicotinamide mononucleotide adenylyltransferase
MAEIVDRAIKVFNNESVAKNWLRTPNPYLDDLIPLNMLESAEGIEHVLEEIGKLKGSIGQSPHFVNEKHAQYTKSRKAISVLANWDEMVPKFVKVMPRDYKRVLQAIQNALASGLSGDDALNAAFEENSRDVARIGGS